MQIVSTIAETRVLPESLDVTWQRMRTAFAESSMVITSLA